MQVCRSGPWVRWANVHPDGGRHADQRGGQWDGGRHGDFRGGLLSAHHAVHHGGHPAPLRDAARPTVGTTARPVVTSVRSTPVPAVITAVILTA